MPSDLFSSSDHRQRPFGFNEILRMLWRYKLMLIICITICVGLAIYALSFMPSMYSSTGKVIIEPVSNSIITPTSTRPGITPDSEIILSEVEILTSPVLIGRVVNDLSLATDDYFTMGDHEITNDMAHRYAVQRVLQGLTVRPIGRSLVISVSYDHPDPVRAATIANAILDHYIDDRIDYKTSTANQATTWLDGRLNDLSTKVRNSAREVADYRRTEKLVDGYKAEVTTQQISEINTQLVMAKTQLAEATARVTQLDAVINGAADLNTVIEVVDSPLIQSMKREETALQRNLSDLKTRYGDNHPAIATARAELSSQRRRINAEVQTIATSLRNDQRVAQSRLESLQSILNDLEDKRGVENQSVIRLQELEREAQSNQQLYQTYLDRLKASDHQDEMQLPDARIVARGIVPLNPSRPNRPLIVLLAAMAGVMIGVMMMALMELLDNGYRTTQDLEDDFNIPALTMVPQVMGKKARRALSTLLIDQPYTAAAEAVRSLRISLFLKGKDGPPLPQVVSVTSSIPGEGKTTLSVWLAQSLALTGKRTIIIDCDMRRPGVHRMVGAIDYTPLIDVLSGVKSVDGLIDIDENTGLHYIYSRPLKRHEAESLSSGQLEALIQSLRSLYDIIILDTPPCLAVADSRLIASISDIVLYAVQWQKTPQKIVHNAIHQLKKDGAPIAGLVMTQVNLKRHVQFGFGDTGSYYGTYHQYFSESAK